MTRDFRQELAAGRVLILDGAMGTMLYSRGVFINQSFEEVNFKNPKLVKEIHEEYLKAGADVLMTNTYNANRERLAIYGLEKQTEEINCQAAQLCREVVGDKAFVAGSMGPLGRNLSFDSPESQEVLEIFEEQARGLLKGNVDLIILETFAHLEEVVLAVKAIRNINEDIPIGAFVTYGIDGITLGGHKPEAVVDFLQKQPLDFIGANCSTGPHAMFDTIQRMAKSCSLPLAAMPNAGAPRVVDGRNLYMATPEYMNKFAKRFIKSGVQLIGGCCGTTPQMIHEIANSVKALSPSRIEVVSISEKPAEEVIDPVPLEELSEMSRRLQEGEFLVSIEVRPPRGIDSGKLLRGISSFKEMGIDFVNIPDSPRATVSMSPMALALQIKEAHNLETIIHYSCRDRNLLGMQSDLLGLHALNIRDILVVTGDPPHMGNYPLATAVFDVDAIGLSRIMDNLNHGLDMGGKPFKQVTGFHHGVGADPGAPDLDREISRYIQKVEAGAKYVMTQPVFDEKIFEKFMEAIKPYRVKTLIGITPFVSHKNCEFFHHEVPGVTVPDKMREIMRKADTGPQAMKEGVAIARDTMAMVKDLCDGAYVMAPLGRYKLPLAVLGKIPLEEIK